MRSFLLFLLSAATVLADPPLVPDPKLTPGATLDVTKEDILTPGDRKKVSDVPQSVKDQVYAEYGISLDLGGSNSIKNLWPQSYVEPCKTKTRSGISSFNELEIQNTPSSKPIQSTSEPKI